MVPDELNIGQPEVFNLIALSKRLLLFDPHAGAGFTKLRSAPPLKRRSSISICAVTARRKACPRRGCRRCVFSS
jgi:hypothetical protein